MRKLLGFTLLEIMIFCAIAALIMTIAIPFAFRHKIFANEAIAKKNLRELAKATENYFNDKNIYPESFGDLLSYSQGPLSEKYFDGCERTGFIYEVVFMNKKGYSFMAKPSIAHRTGKKIYFIETGGIISDAPIDRPLSFRWLFS